jgi:hypothetical protein
MACLLMSSLGVIGWGRANQHSWMIILLYGNLHRTRWMASNILITGTQMQASCLPFPHFVGSSKLAPVDLFQQLRDSDMRARNALSSFLAGCCLDETFCFILLNDHAMPSFLPTSHTTSDGPRF